MSEQLIGTSPTRPTTLEDLDAVASDLIAALQRAYQGSAKRSLGQQVGQPWWNEDCRLSRQLYRIGDCTKRDFRRTVRHAKLQFWRGRLDAAAQAKDVFDMTKWHKSKGSYCNPPLKDPLFPSQLPATSLPDKRDVLAKNLLQNTSEIGDIPLDAPAVPCTALPFPLVQDIDVERAILQAGNTAPGADEIPTSTLQISWPLIKDRV